MSQDYILGGIKPTELYPNLPLKKKEREKGKKYIKYGEIRIWDGICLNCKHNFEVQNIPKL